MGMGSPSFGIFFFLCTFLWTKCGLGMDGYGLNDNYGDERVDGKYIKIVIKGIYGRLD